MQAFILQIFHPSLMRRFREEQSESLKKLEIFRQKQNLTAQNYFDKGSTNKQTLG